MSLWVCQGTKRTKETRTKRQTCAFLMHETTQLLQSGRNRHRRWVSLSILLKSQFGLFIPQSATRRRLSAGSSGNHPLHNKKASGANYIPHVRHIQWIYLIQWNCASSRAFVRPSADCQMDSEDDRVTNGLCGVLLLINILWQACWAVSYRAVTAQITSRAGLLLLSNALARPDFKILTES